MLLHSAPHAYKGREITKEEQKHISAFIKGLCHLLPCPDCMGGCSRYTRQKGPNVSTFELFRRYFIDFHNMVNLKTKKMYVEPEDADQLLANYLKTFKIGLDDIHTAFLQDYWSAMMMMGHAYSMDPDEPTETEQKHFRNMLEHICYILPFALHKDEKGVLVRDKLLEAVRKFKDDQFATREGALRGITTMFNASCGSFGIINRTTDEMMGKFSDQFSINSGLELTRSHQIREEDHKRMRGMENELNRLRDGASPDETEKWRAATIGLAVFSIVLMIVLVYTYLTLRKNSKLLEHAVSRSSRKPSNAYQEGRFPAGSANERL